MPDAVDDRHAFLHGAAERYAGGRLGKGGRRVPDDRADEVAARADEAGSSSWAARLAYEIRPTASRAKMPSPMRSRASSERGESSNRMRPLVAGTSEKLRNCALGCQPQGAAHA